MIASAWPIFMIFPSAITTLPMQGRRKLMLRLLVTVIGSSPVKVMIAI